MRHQSRLPVNRGVEVALVGCGGTGSQVLTGLARLDVAMRALGHPGIRVTVFDDDVVSPANVGRQLFYASDVGMNKAEVLVNRVNAAFGLRFAAVPQAFGLGGQWGVHYHLLVGAVDTRASRKAIHEWGIQRGGTYWLDIGNRASEGQVVLGEFVAAGRRDWYMRLPLVSELFPEAIGEDDPEDGQPSCSLAAALEKQELFVNQAVATQALQTIWQLMRYGWIDRSATFLNLMTGSVSSLPIDREVWRRFGHKTARKPPTRKAARST